MTKDLTIKLNFRDLLRKTFPSMLLMVITSMYTVVDSLFVSNVVGTTALASINIAFPLITIINAFGFMIAIGGMSWVSIKLGAGKHKEALGDFSFIVYFGFVVTLIISYSLIPILSSLVKMLGANSIELINYTKSYLFWIIIFSPLFILQILFQNFYFVDGNGKLALILTIISGVVNIVFDYLLIVVWDVGVEGAAIATGLGYFASALVGTVYFIKNKKGLHFTKSSNDMRVIKGSLSNGMSEMVSNISSSITTYYFNYLTLKYIGVDGVAAISIIMYCQFLFISIFFGFCMGTNPLIGFGWGREDFRYTKNLIKLCYKFVLLLSVLMFIISYAEADIITGFFTSRDNPVYDIATNAFRIFSFSFLFCGVSIFTSDVFTSIGDGKRSAIVSFFRVLVLTVLFLTIFPPLFGENGIWLAVPVAEFIMVFVSIIYIRNLFNRIDFSVKNKKL